MSQVGDHCGGVAGLVGLVVVVGLPLVSAPIAAMAIIMAPTTVHSIFIVLLLSLTLVLKS